MQLFPTNLSKIILCMCVPYQQKIWTPHCTLKIKFSHKKNCRFLPAREESTQERVCQRKFCGANFSEHIASPQRGTTRREKSFFKSFPPTLSLRTFPHFMSAPTIFLLLPFHFSSTHDVC